MNIDTGREFPFPNPQDDPDYYERYGKYRHNPIFCDCGIGNDDITFGKPIKYIKQKKEVKEDKEVDKEVKEVKEVKEDKNINQNIKESLKESLKELQDIIKKIQDRLENI